MLQLACHHLWKSSACTADDQPDRQTKAKDIHLVSECNSIGFPRAPVVRLPCLEEVQDVLG